MAAAIAAAEAGLRPTIIDENPRPGGQIYRQPPPTFHRDRPPKTPTASRGAALLRRFEALRDRMDVRTGTAVWGLFPPRRLALRTDDGTEWLEPEHLVLAQGACELVPPFPGWTLPGVLTPGGAQLFVKTMGVLPGKRALVAGTGPFLLVVADQLHRAGVEVAGIVELARRREVLRALPGLLASPGLCWEGLGLVSRLRRAGIPIHRGHIVLEAKGDEGVREVVVAPCDGQGRPDRGRSWTVAVDTLCVGCGFVPRTSLAQLAGCRMAFDEQRGGWVPTVDADLHTSAANVWVAGDGGGVGGAVAAQLQGTLAGLAVAQALGAIDTARFHARRRSLVRQLARLGRFRDALAWLSRWRPGLDTLATPDTLVCRCEEVTLAEVEAGIAAGGTDVRTLKVMTRLGMGPCQGLFCWPSMARRIAARTGRPVEAIGPLSVRPPVAPIRLGDLAGSNP
jgi:NADPH-dependent 2,4-dienoyl-CoA reductase/sulfur reductase-like enzyme